jgi:hypothetical protein
MRYMVEKNFVQVLGKIWMPPTAVCGYEYPLRKYDIDNIGEFTRENVEQWLAANAGDFSQIIDFYATVGDKEIPWAKEDSESRYCDILFPEEDE